MPLTTATAVDLYGVKAWLEGTKENFGMNRQSRCVRTIVTAWKDRGAIINGLLGVGATESGAIIETSYPATYPIAAWMYVDDIDIEGVGLLSADDLMEAYEWARLTVTYKVPDVLYGTETGVQSLEFSDEVLTFPSDDPAFNWAAGPQNGKPVDAEIARSVTITLITYTYLRKFQPSIPSDLITSCIDKTNSAPLLGGPEGTVIYKGAQTTRQITNIGTQQWDITHKLIYRSVGWNSFLLPGKGFFPVVRSDSGLPPFPEANLAPLLNS